MKTLRSRKPSVAEQPVPFAPNPAVAPDLPSERQHELRKWNQTATKYPRHGCVHELFEAEAREHPLSEAVRYGRYEVLSYGQLNARANQLAHYMMAHGIRPGDSVAICLERSLDLIVAIVAILKTGAAYAPLSSRSPPNRLSSMLQDLCVTAVITSKRFRAGLEAATLGNGPRPQLICQESLGKRLDECATSNPAIRAPAEQVAYISFTSGSTGRPKGVCIPHRGIVRLVRNTYYASFGPGEVFLQLAPVSFDASLFEIWGSLLNGARLIMAPPQLPTFSELARLIQEAGVTTAWFTAGLFNQMVEEVPEVFNRLGQVLTGGEAASPFHIRKALAYLGSGRLINGYGPTENCTFTTTFTVPKNFDGTRPVPIGKPIANTTCYLLDRNLNPVPVGGAGELYAGGDGLAAGYLNRPDQTAQRFVTNPFCPGTRLYRTGDRARYLPDGNIEFLGRMDLQVKIRGFRVEPGEVESKLLQHPGVRQCVVVARADASGLKRLVAYVVSQDAPGDATQGLRSFLRRQLPDYMVPSFFVRLNRLPLNQNGKLDHAALPSPKIDSVAEAQPTHATGPYEAELQHLWQDLFELPSIRVTDNFFALGGHSLMAMRMAAEIEKRLTKGISVAAIFQNPTIRQLAARLRGDSSPTEPSPLIPLQPNGTRPPLILIHGAGGGMIWGYSNLARHLGKDQPVFAFKSRGLDGQNEPETICQLAGGYVRDLLLLQPNGPYYLGGYCFGGLVAYEMARKLEEQGRRTELLALFNTSPPNSSYTQFTWTPGSTWNFIRNLVLKAAYGFRRSPEQWRRFLAWRGHLLWKRLSARVWAAADLDPANADGWADLSGYTGTEQRLWQVHVKAWTTYQPQPYGGRLTLFRSPVHQLYSSFDHSCGWHELARGGVEVTVVPSGHDTILKEPQVKTVADGLSRALQNEIS